MEAGYGRFNFNSKEYSAHRVSWIIHNGKIPADMCILHTCDNPPCVNPKHLWLGTLKENSQDMVRKGRATPKRGNNKSWKYAII